MVRKSFIAALLGLSLVFASGQAKAADPIPGSEPGWYKCSGSGGEVSEAASAEKADPGVVREWKNSRDGQIYQERLNQESGQFYTARKPNKWENPENGDREDGKLWKSPFCTPRDSWSTKKPPQDSKKVTAVRGFIPTPALKFAKGKTMKAVAVNSGSGRIEDGFILPSGSDKNGKLPVVVYFNSELTGSASDWKIVSGDRFFNNAIGGDKRGELVVWGLEGTKYAKLQGGMYEEKDPEYMALVAETYGTSLDSLQRTSLINKGQLDGVIRAAGLNKYYVPMDGIRYAADRGELVEACKKPDRRRGYVRFADDGGLTISPEPIGMAMSAGSALFTSTVLRNHNTPCLSTETNGVELFEKDFAFWQSFRKDEKVGAYPNPAKSEKSYGQSYVRENNANIGGEIPYRQFVADVKGQGQTFNDYIDLPQRIRWWVDPKRVEIPIGGGISREPNLSGRFAWHNIALRPFEAELAPNVFLGVGPAAKFGWYEYQVHPSEFSGSGCSRSFGIWPEIITRHDWGGTDTTIGLLAGRRWEKGDFNYRMSRRYATVDAATEFWWKPVKSGKYGKLLPGAKAFLLWETDGFFHAGIMPVLYQSPCDDLFKISAGPAFLRFRHGPKGGGGKVQVEVGGVYLSYGRYFGKRNYYLDSVDFYRVFWTIQGAMVECGTKEVPWDTPEIEPIVPAVLPPAPIIPAEPKIICPPAVEKAPPVKVKKPPKRKKKLRERCPAVKPETPIKVPALPIPAPQETKPEQPITPDKPEQPAQAPTPVPDAPKVEQPVLPEVPDGKIIIPSIPEKPEAKPAEPPAMPPQTPAEVKPEQPITPETPKAESSAPPQFLEKPQNPVAVPEKKDVRQAGPDQD
ncbi:MAG: hypothetical protein WC831_01225 [Parcubacteria group bacterium]|jgi:hypothetical protein